MKITTAILAVLVAGTFTYATAESCEKGQGPSKGERGPKGERAERGEDNSERMAKALNLTAEQQTKVNAIMKANGDKMKAMFDAKEVEREAARKSGAKKPSKEEMDIKHAAMRANMKIMRDAVQAEVKAILTADQQTKFDEMIAKRDAKHDEMEKGEKGGRGDRKGGRRGGRKGEEEAGE